MKIRIGMQCSKTSAIMIGAPVVLIGKEVPPLILLYILLQPVLLLLDLAKLQK